MDDPFTLLRIQIDWGADEALDVDPLDRLRAAGLAAPALARPTPRPVSAAPPPPQPAGVPAERALAAAIGAQTLEALRDAIAAFDGCPLRDTASNLVWAEGDPDSPALIVGEAPGRDEDRTGHPFAGVEGELLDQMLASIALTRGQLMLVPLLPWRPPGGRPPSAAELAVCLPFLHRLIVLQAPRFILLLGSTAARALLPASAARRRQTPEWVDFSIPGMQNTINSLALPGLAEMLRTLPMRRVAWAGLRLLRRALDTA